MNLLTDDPLAVDGRLPAVLLDNAPRLGGRCGARVWRARRDQPVLAQCQAGCADGVEFCGAHRLEAQRPFGTWDPEHDHRCLTRHCADRFRLAVREARLREARGAGVPAQPGAYGRRGSAAAAAAAARQPRAPVQQPRYRPLPEDCPGELREFDADPIALPPFPCRLCDKNFATRESFMQHVEQRHNGWPEYRKRLFYLAEHWDGVRPIRPQEWRACVEAFAEHLVTGSSDWPACPAAAGAAEAPAADAPREWWKAAGAGGDQVGEVGVGASPVDIGALGGVPPPPPPYAEDAGAEADSARRAVRCRIACCVCARLDWADNLRRVHFWRQPEGAAAGERSILCDAEPQPPARAEEAAGGGEGEARAMRMTQRQRAQQLLAPARYHARWRFVREDADGVAWEGGIPLKELEASAVRDPGPDGQLWLLHKKSFRMVSNSRGEQVADASQKVPICVGCNAALSKKMPTMPKYALANDLWIGRQPPPLRNLSLGAKLLLPLARGIVRRFNCKTDSGSYMPVDERI